MCDNPKVLAAILDEFTSTGVTAEDVRTQYAGEWVFAEIAVGPDHTISLCISADALPELARIIDKSSRMI